MFDFERDTLAKAVFGFLPDDGSAVTVRAITHSLEISEDEARHGLEALVAGSLAVQKGPDRYSRTDLAPRPDRSRPMPLPA